MREERVMNQGIARKRERFVGSRDRAVNDRK